MGGGGGGGGGTIPSGNDSSSSSSASHWYNATARIIHVSAREIYRPTLRPKTLATSSDSISTIWQVWQLGIGELASWQILGADFAAQVGGKRGVIDGDETTSSVSAGEVPPDDNAVSGHSLVAPHVALLGILSAFDVLSTALSPPPPSSHHLLLLPHSLRRAYRVDPSVHVIPSSPRASVAKDGIFSSPSSVAPLVCLFSCLVWGRLDRRSPTSVVRSPC